jgi:hypothetical protein
VLLYSPRKLVGVADGGLLVSDAALPEPEPGRAGEDELWAPEDARSGDPDGRAPERWFPLFQRREGSYRVDGRPMSLRSVQALRAAPAADLDRRRRENYAHLAGRLGDYALWPEGEAAFSPLAFPIRVEAQDFAVKALAGQGLFCARHWAELPCPSDRFEAAWRVAGTILSVPCDPRYGAADMDRAAEAIRALCRPARR